MKFKPSFNILACLLAFIVITLPTMAAEVAPENTVKQLQASALSSDLAWETLASITSEVGPRMAGG